MINTAKHSQNNWTTEHNANRTLNIFHSENDNATENNQGVAY